MNTCTVLALAALLVSSAPRADAQERPNLPVILFALLPEDFRHPESLAVDPVNGQIYVGSFDSRDPASDRDNQILRLSADGKLLARVHLGATPITGLAFERGHAYFLNFGASKLQRLPADFTDANQIEDIASFGALSPAAPADRTVPNPDGSHDLIKFGSGGFPAINGLAFDRDGNAYVSDSFQGAVYRIGLSTDCRPCEVTVLIRDPLLATTGSLPFGANGLAVDDATNTIYINNAGDGRVLKMALSGGDPEILAESLLGADGLELHDGLLWVSANQADAVVALDLQGRELIRAGQFLGIEPNGSPRGLLFPAATAIQGKRVIVANLALPLTPRQGDEWEDDVTRWNLMQFDLPDPPGAALVGQARPSSSESSP